MTDQQLLLQRAANEIKSLRANNQIMNARLQMFDNIMTLITISVRQDGMAMSPDIVWEIEKTIERQTEKENVKSN